MTQSNKIDIHLVSWHRPKITELAIKTIVRNTNPDNYRLVVLDNNSPPTQLEMLYQLHENGYIDELITMPQNLGLEGARDYLLKNATQSEYFICADNDCLPQPKLGDADWVDLLKELMTSYKDYAAISCRTQVMIGTGNIFEEADEKGDDLVDFPHPGGSLRIMNTQAVQKVGGWNLKREGRGAEERYICGQLREAGYKTAFATNVRTLHLFGEKKITDRWGYDSEWQPEKTGHSDISHPALEQGDDYNAVAEYAGEELAKEYFNVISDTA